jgi:uncharacterized protein (TIGR02145 family)
MNICGVDFSKKLKSINGWNNNGTNKFKWYAFPAGRAVKNFGFNSIGEKARFYSKTKTGNFYGLFGLDDNDNDSTLYPSGSSDYNYMSFRLVRNI